MKIEELGEKERALLLKALNFDLDNLKCQVCGEKLDYKKCCIFPAVLTPLQATLTCDNVFCMISYLEYAGVEIE